MDLSILRALNGLTGHGWDALIVFCASYLQYILVGAVALASVWPVRRMKLLAGSLGAALIARLGVKSLLLLFISRARPFTVIGDLHNLVDTAPGENLQSFPSGHAIFFFALAMAAYRYDHKLGRWLFAGAAVMGVARVIVGTHWPSDILGGAILGIAIGWATVQYIPALRRELPQQSL